MVNMEKLMENIKISESKMVKQTDSHQYIIQQLMQSSQREKLRDVLVNQFLTTAEQFIKRSRFIDEIKQIKCATSEIRMAKSKSKALQERGVRSHFKKIYKIIKTIQLMKDNKNPINQTKYYPKRISYKRVESCPHLQTEEYYQNVDPCNEVHQVEYDYAVKNEDYVLMNRSQFEYGTDPSLEKDNNTMYAMVKTKATLSSKITASSSCECCEHEKQNYKIKNELYNSNDCKRCDTLEKLSKKNLHELEERVEKTFNETIDTFSFDSESIKSFNENLKNVESCSDNRIISRFFCGSVDEFHSSLCLCDKDVQTIASVPTINANCAVIKSIDQSDQALSTELRAAPLQLKHTKNMENACTKYSGNRKAKSSRLKVIEQSSCSSSDESTDDEINWNDGKADMWSDLIRKIMYVEGAPKRAQKRKQCGLPLRKSDSMSYCFQQIMTTGFIILPEKLIKQNNEN